MKLRKHIERKLSAKVIILLSTSLFAFLSCEETKISQDPLTESLMSDDPSIARVIADPGKFEVQVRYTRIHRSADSVGFTDYDYRVDPNIYYYPASTVKFPIAVAALEKLHELDSLDRTTRYYIEGDTMENTFEEDIVQIFAVSDNHANNRLFEFLGQDDINKRLARKEAGPVRISHRLGYHRDDLTTQPLVIYLNDSLTTLSLPIENSPTAPLELAETHKGVGFMEGDSLIEEPFDFSQKNYLPLPTLHGLMKRVIFPEAFPPSQRFDISSDQRDFLMRTMRILPREAGYSETDKPDGYCKFFLFGDTNDRIPEHIEIYNKVGFAYGTLTDCAYIVDRKSGVEFLMTATILVNENGIFNDDSYEYEEIGLPFLASLGREVYQFELAQKNR